MFMSNENTRSEQQEVASHGRIARLKNQGRQLVAFAQVYLSPVPELPIEKPKEVHFDEDGMIMRHDDQPELVGTIVGGHTDLQTPNSPEVEE